MGSDYYEIVTPAAEEPVTLAEAKAWCKVTHSSEDTLFTALIKSCTEKLEKYSNRIFVEREFTGFFSGFKCSRYEKGFFLAVRRAPMGSVSAVEVTSDGSQEVVATDDYDLKMTASFSRIIFSEVGFDLDLLPYPLQVDFTAGYGGAADVPEAIKTAIKEYVCFLYSNRGDCSDAGMKSGGIPVMVRAIMDEYRIVNTYG